jgi:methylmalonyl-CoA/ethylmalonyl-CoA epimerase
MTDGGGTGQRLRRRLPRRLTGFLDRYGLLPEDATAAASSMERAVSINHIGLCVPNIEAFLAANEIIYGSFRRMGPALVNERQRVRELFITDGSTVLELLEPSDDSSPLAAFLSKNPAGGLVHVCLECDDIEAMIRRIKDAGGMLITGPIPDIAFDERHIAFCALADQVIELVERKTD